MTGGVDLSVDHVGGEASTPCSRSPSPAAASSLRGDGGTEGHAGYAQDLLKHLTVLGTAMGTDEEFGAMLDLYAEHGLRPVINKTFSLEDAPSALEHMEEGEGIGKIVLEVPE